jgi:hypothetical protein
MRLRLLNSDLHRAYLWDTPSCNQFHGSAILDFKNGRLTGELTRCQHCRQPILFHTQMKCLFDCTTYEPMKNSWRPHIDLPRTTTELLEFAALVLDAGDVAAVDRFAANDTVQLP